MTIFKFVRGIARSFIKLVPEIQPGSGKVTFTSERTNGCLGQYIGELHFNGRCQIATYRNSSRCLAKFSRTVCNGIIGKCLYGLPSQTAQLRRQAMSRLLQNSGSKIPVFAFLGFAYSKSTSSPPKEIQEQEELQELHKFVQESFKALSSNAKESSTSAETIDLLHGRKINHYEFNERLGERSSNSAVYSASLGENEFAIKMLFNYDVESRTASLYRAFAKECQVLSVNTSQVEPFYEGNPQQTTFTNLPPHENIVPVLHTFADDVPLLHDATDTYPAALPSRHHENGLGRNRSLFIVMPRYSRTVRQYINDTPNINYEVSTLLLLQLLQGISHVARYGVSHRDLKTDNLLLDETVPGCPHLAICDFGCCLADRRLGLCLPYTTDETDKGGNRQLMAPEVSSVAPGENVFIDYSKSDAWAAGAIAYELFGEVNPFSYSMLDSATYQDNEIPPLARAPPAVRKVVSLLLKRDPDERISASDAVFLLYVSMFTPRHWLTFDVKLCNVTRWLLQQILERLKDQGTNHQNSLQQKIYDKFLQEATADDIIEALEILRETDVST